MRAISLMSNCQHTTSGEVIAGFAARTDTQVHLLFKIIEGNASFATPISLAEINSAGGGQVIVQGCLVRQAAVKFYDDCSLADMLHTHLHLHCVGYVVERSFHAPLQMYRTHLYLIRSAFGGAEKL